MKPGIIVLIVLFVLISAGVIALVVYLRELKLNAGVMSTSEKIRKLADLNNSTSFHNIQPSFSVTKHYDNKTNYLKIEPAYLMSAEIRSNMAFYSDYFKKVFENRTLKEKYEAAVHGIRNSVTAFNPGELRISEENYCRREEKLFEKQIIKPVVDCIFTVEMSYSSPKGRVNLYKGDRFSFEEMYTSFNSVSRERLDRNTYKKLAAVERGEISDSLRYDILRRDNFSCVICGASAREGARLHVDHIVPISKGGKSVPENLRTLCERCNIGKSAKTEENTQPKSDGSVNEMICQRCGGRLVLRHGPYGDFYGCSNYPQCKVTKRIN